ncbi:MAG: PilZ domain-containing protein [Pontibacterium sp.]
MSQNTSAERRRFTRVNFDAQTTILHQGSSYNVQLADISFKGLLITSDTPLPIASGDHCLIQLQLGDQLLSMPAQLTHNESDHYGFKIGNLDIDTITHLRRLVELNLGDESLFERELEQLLPPE